MSQEKSHFLFAPFEWMVALRYLRARRAGRFVSVIAGFSFLGISLGVATLIVVMSVMNGFHIELLNKIIGINGHVFVQTPGEPMRDYDKLVAELQKMPDVSLVLPMLESPAGISSQFNQSGGLIRGIKEGDLKNLPGIKGHVVTGKLEGFDQAGGVAIGVKIAETLSLRVGDIMTILTPKGASTPFGMLPRMKSYPVVAIFQIGITEFDGLFVYMPLAEAQAYFNKPGEASVIELFSHDPERVDLLRTKITQTISQPLLLTDWRERNKSFFDALAIERDVMFIILTLIILVAALNIISGLTMLVKDKNADIAILRTMGASRAAILRIFFLTGSCIGVVGTFSGVFLGLLVAHYLEPIRQHINQFFGLNLFDPNLYLLSRLPTVIVPGDVMAIMGLSLGLSFLATLYPAWQAAKLDPVEALRYG